VAWKLEKGNNFLPGLTLEDLERLYSIEKKAKPKQRLLCAIHRKQGESIDSIKNVMHMPRRTVHGCLKRFEERGIKAKDCVKQSGRPPLLTEKQMKELIRYLEEGPLYNKNDLWSTKEVRDLIKRKYGITFVNQHIWRIIRELGFTIQRPRKKHYKSASASEIEAFKKKQKERQDITARKALSWAQRMRPLSA